MAVSRFDGRGQLLLTEANETTSAYVWASLLPSPEGRELEDRLRQYVDRRVDTAWRSRDDRAVTAHRARRFEVLHHEMWLVAAVLSRRNADSAPLNRFVESLTDLVAVHERLLSAFETQVPGAVLPLLSLGATGTSLLVGYGSGLHGPRNALVTIVYSMLVCLVILTIVDLDRPRLGLIRVSERSLEQIQRQLGPLADSGVPETTGSRASRPSATGATTARTCWPPS
jgi:hypothetical protein